MMHIVDSKCGDEMVNDQMVRVAEVGCARL